MIGTPIPFHSSTRLHFAAAHISDRSPKAPFTCIYFSSGCPLCWFVSFHFPVPPLPLSLSLAFSIHIRSFVRSFACSSDRKNWIGFYSPCLSSPFLLSSLLRIRFNSPFRALALSSFFVAMSSSLFLSSPISISVCLSVRPCVLALPFPALPCPALPGLPPFGAICIKEGGGRRVTAGQTDRQTTHSHQCHENKWIKKEREGESDFFQAVVLSSSSHSLTYSRTPIKVEGSSFLLLSLAAFIHASLPT